MFFIIKYIGAGKFTKKGSHSEVHTVFVKIFRIFTIGEIVLRDSFYFCDLLP